MCYDDEYKIDRTEELSYFEPIFVIEPEALDEEIGCEISLLPFLKELILN